MGFIGVRFANLILFLNIPWKLNNLVSFRYGGCWGGRRETLWFRHWLLARVPLIVLLLPCSNVFSWYHGLVCDLRLWYFLVLLTFLNGTCYGKHVVIEANQLTFCILMDFPIHCSVYILRDQIMVYFFPEDYYHLNSSDPDEISQHEEFYLGFHCLWKYLSVSRIQRVKWLKPIIASPKDNKSAIKFNEFIFKRQYHFLWKEKSEAIYNKPYSFH